MGYMTRSKSYRKIRIHHAWREYHVCITAVSLFTAGENVVTWHRVSTWVSPLPFYSVARRSLRLLEVEEFNNGRGRVARWRARAHSSRERGSALLLECWWPAEVALIHRNFTGCQAGLTGLCHGSNAEESHPTEISVSSPGSVRAATESRMNLDVAHTYLSTCVVEIDLCDLYEFHLGVVTPPTPPIDSEPIGGF